MQDYTPYGGPQPSAPPAYGYPQPQPMYVPGPMAPYAPPMPAFETRDGVKFVTYAMLINIISAIIGFVLSLAVLVVIASNWSNWSTSATNALGAIVIAAVALGVLAFVSFIIFLIALYKFYSGKMEFGPVHEKNVIRGFVYWLLSFIIPFLGGVVGAIAAVGLLISGDYTNAFRLILIVVGVMGVVGAYFSAMMYRTFVLAFTTDEAQKFKTATILMIISPIVGLIVGAVAIPAKIASGAQSGVSYISDIGGIINVIAIWFFYQGYKNILGKMESGAIRPAPMPMPVPGYAPPPMPPQPYQAPPQYPPQQYPPQQYQQYPPQQYPPQQPPQYPPPQY